MEQDACAVSIERVCSRRFSGERIAVNCGEADLDFGDEAFGDVVANGDRVTGSAVDDCFAVFTGLRDERLRIDLDTSVR